MFIDKLLSPAIKLPLQGLTVSTQILGTVMDFGVARANGLLATPYGPGWDINIRGATSGGAATLNLMLITSAAANMSSPTTLFSTGVQVLAALTKSDLFVPVPDSELYLRYVAWQATVGGAVFTGGTLSVEFAANARRFRAYQAQGNY